MKTWTNPTVEELDVKNTAYYYAWWQVEEANGVLDDSLLWGTDDNDNSGNQGNQGNQGNEGSGEDEGGFGNES